MVTVRPDHQRAISRLIRRPGVALAAVCLGLVACSGDDNAIPSTSTATSDDLPAAEKSTSTSTEPADTTSSMSAPSDSVEAVVAARYLEFWSARFEANTDPVDPDSPRLRDLATGEQLANVVTETQQRKDAGLALREAEDPVRERRVRVVEVEGDAATIQDCATNDDVVYRVSNGEVVDDSVVTRSISADMRLVDGQWRLAGARELQQWEGVAGCALSSDS